MLIKSEDIVVATGVSVRPDLLSLQLQMIRKFVTPYPHRYLVFCDPSSRGGCAPQAVLEATEKVCDEYGAELILLPACVDRTQFRKKIIDYTRVNHNGYVLLIEDDVMPIAPLELTETTFARFLGGVLTGQLQYRPVEFEFDNFYLDYENKFDIKYESYRCRDEECLPEQIRGLGFHESLNGIHEFYGSFIHYDRASAIGYEHESVAKDAFFNAIVKSVGLIPFSKSFARNVSLPKRQWDAIGPDIYNLSATDITYMMRNNPEKATLGDMMRNIKEATKRVSTAYADGEKLRVDKEEYEKRLSICKGCVTYYEPMLVRCSHKECGCLLKGKARLSTEVCPIGRWKMSAEELVLSGEAMDKMPVPEPEPTPQDNIKEFIKLLLERMPSDAVSLLHENGMFVNHDEHSLMRIAKANMKMDDFEILMREHVMPNRIIGSLQAQCEYLKDSDNESYDALEKRVVDCLKNMRMSNPASATKESPTGTTVCIYCGCRGENPCCGRKHCTYCKKTNF